MSKNGTNSSIRNSRNQFRRLNPVPEEYNIKKKKWSKMTLIYPDSKFKIIWDLVIIILSVYNSLLIPYQFAYSAGSNLFLDILDRIIDSLFMIDIIINFRTVFKDKKTDELVANGKRIALNYIL